MKMYFHLYSKLLFHSKLIVELRLSCFFSSGLFWTKKITTKKKKKGKGKEAEDNVF